MHRPPAAGCEPGIAADVKGTADEAQSFSRRVKLVSCRSTPEPKHAEPKRRERVVRRGDYQSFETYDPKSDTYKGYDGQRHPTVLTGLATPTTPPGRAVGRKTHSPSRNGRI
jgi:hypothetical protein